MEWLLAKSVDPSSDSLCVYVESMHKPWPAICSANFTYTRADAETSRSLYAVVR